MSQLICTFLLVCTWDCDAHSRQRHIESTLLLVLRTIAIVMHDSHLCFVRHVQYSNRSSQSVEYMYIRIYHIDYIYDIDRFHSNVMHTALVQVKIDVYEWWPLVIESHQTVLTSIQHRTYDTSRQLFHDWTCVDTCSIYIDFYLEYHGRISAIHQSIEVFKANEMFDDYSLVLPAIKQALHIHWLSIMS
jgi:hypothetical protein